MRVSFVLALLCLFPTGAFAAAPGGQVQYDPSSVNYEPPATLRRGGFALGLTYGLGWGVYRGYELKVDALDDPTSRQSTGTALASSLNLWLGGSPRDWITTGLGVGLYGAAQPELAASAAAFLVHVEVFPLFALGGGFQDLGFAFDGGLGNAQIFDRTVDDRADASVADSGSLSTLGFNVFYEPIRLWHFSMGPALQYTYGFSQSMNVNQVTLGFRAALYGVQPKKQGKGR